MGIPPETHASQAVGVTGLTTVELLEEAKHCLERELQRAEARLPRLPCPVGLTGDRG